MSATKENENTLDKTRSSQPVSMLPPLIAIHGVGNHEPGNISETLRKTFESASLSAEIDDFNWDSFADHSIKNVDDAYSLLGTTAESISQAAAQPLKPSRRKIDIFLFQLGEGLYQGLMRVVVALGLATLIIGPLLQLLVLLPSALFGMISWQDFKWVTVAATVVIAACVIVITGLFVLTILRSLITLSLRPLWVSVRRLSLLFLQPVFLLLTIPVSIRFGGGIVKLLGTIVPMMFISVVLAIVTSPLTGSFEETISDIGLSLSLLIGVTAIAGLHILLRKLWVGALLKVILDITRYVGSSTYRTKLQNALDDKIRDTRKRDSSQKIILYTHSLGSVIALDSLINSGVWGSDDEVCLVTLGSPISRFFIRFFPGYLFPASIENAAAIAARRLGRFTWINIHRRWDYVGTGLGLDRSNLGIELCTGQISKVFSSHSNYWGDGLVVEKFKAGLNKAFPVPCIDGVDFDYEIPTPLENSIQLRLAQIVQKFAIALVVIVIAIAFSNFYQSRKAWVDSIDQETAQLQQQGIVTRAQVTYRRTLEGSGEDSYYLHHFNFTLPETANSIPIIEIPDNVIYDKNARRFDYKALARFVLQDCIPAEEKKWWQIFKSKKSIPCTRNGILIRLDADDPGSFWLPDFPAKKTWGGLIAEIFGSLVLAVFFALGCFILIPIGGVALFRLFLGLKIEV